LRLISAAKFPVYISFNSNDIHEILLPETTIELNLQTNSSPNNFSSLLKKGTVVSVQGFAGIGYVYLVGYYNEVI